MAKRREKVKSENKQSNDSMDEQMESEENGETEEIDQQSEGDEKLYDRQESVTENKEKKKKRGIIYLSTIPRYMNVTKIREIFAAYGTVGRVYLQLADNGTS